MGSPVNAAPMNASRQDPHAPLLIVDDDADTRDAFLLLFESEGYSIVGADSIADARTYLRRATAPHVVLLDFLLPPENADSLLAAVEQEAPLRRHRYLLISATPPTRFSAEAQQLIARVCTQVMLKPFDVADLLAAVARAEVQVSVCPAPENS